MKVYKLNDKNYNNIYELSSTIKYLKAMENEDFYKILDYIEECEFSIEINKNGTINLIDLQGAYLGGIESYGNFENIFDACQRLEGSFLYDYFNIYV